MGFLTNACLNLQIPTNCCCCSKRWETPIITLGSAILVPDSIDGDFFKHRPVHWLVNDFESLEWLSANYAAAYLSKSDFGVKIRQLK